MSPLTLKVCQPAGEGSSHLLVVAGDQDDPRRQDPSPSSHRGCVQKGGEGSEGQWVGRGGLLRELMPVGVQGSIQGALFPQRALLWGGPPLLGLREGPLLNGTASGHGTGQEFCGHVHP